MPKFVVSSTLTDDEADWNNSTVKEFARDILVAGSANLVRTLSEHDLVDEYRLMVYPIVLGSGKRLFAGGMPRTKLRLVDTEQVGPDRVLILAYQPIRWSGQRA